jgi:hypothetical protein
MAIDSNQDVRYVMMNNTYPSATDDEKLFISNHSGYGYKESANFEHDDTGSLMNFSGCVDDIYQAFIEHEDWQEGYDY